MRLELARSMTLARMFLAMSFMGSSVGCDRSR
jgi:hypothetical protein